MKDRVRAARDVALKSAADVPGRRRRVRLRLRARLLQLLPLRLHHLPLRLHPLPLRVHLHLSGLVHLSAHLPRRLRRRQHLRPLRRHSPRGRRSKCSGNPRRLRRGPHRLIRNRGAGARQRPLRKIGPLHRPLRRRQLLRRRRLHHHHRAHAQRRQPHRPPLRPRRRLQRLEAPLPQHRKRAGAAGPRTVGHRRGGKLPVKRSAVKENAANADNGPEPIHQCRCDVRSNS